MRWLLLVAHPVMLVAVVFVFLGLLDTQDLVEPRSITFAITREPIGVDPLTNQDPVSEEIESLLFDSLLGRNEGMEVEGQLAESWSFRSRVWVYFRSAEKADEALRALTEGRSRRQWAGWHLEKVERVGDDEALLSFSDPEAEAMDSVLEVFPEGAVAPLTRWTLATEYAAERSIRMFQNNAREGWQLRRMWSRGDGYVEFFSAGEEADFSRELFPYLQANLSLRPEVRKEERLSYLVEPTMIMNLRSGVRWHDGKPFSVVDVLHSIELARNSQQQPMVVSGLMPILEMEPRGPLSFEVIYRGQFGPKLEIWERLRILPAHAWHAFTPRIPEIPLVGTGPFTISRWETGGPIELRRNLDYFQGVPDNERIIYRRLLENRLRRSLFQIRAIDCYEADPATYKNLEAQPEFRLVRSAPVIQTYIAWNLGSEMLQDRTVREALAWAVDTDALIDDLLGGHGQWVDQLFHPWAQLDRRVESLIGFDQGQAEILLDEAGWAERRFGGRYKKDKVFTFQLTYVASDAFQRKVARALQQQWRELDIQVQLRPVPFGAISAIQSGNMDYEAVLVSHTLPHYLDQFGRWHSSQIGPGKGNFTQLRDEETDSLLDQIRASYDAWDRRRLAADFQQRNYELQPRLHLFLRDSARVFHQGALQVKDHRDPKERVRVP
ncbi:MAG: ABC transporter substrate-binding protein, partial [Verrucomicrobiota bacterium]